MRSDVLTTASLLAEHSDEEATVERLVAQGFGRLQAELLVAFVPLGLARAIITRLPVSSAVQLSSTALVQDPMCKQSYEINLEDVPEFEEARQLGDETFESGVIPRDEFGLASGMSAELAVINKALNAGTDVSGATIAAPILLRLAETPGFCDWYQNLTSH